MNRLPEIELMRLLHGELSPERSFELHERLAREPELAKELARLEATWDRLELPPAAPVPRGFARSVAARAENAGLWSTAPTRVRVLGGALLAAGLAVGVGLSAAVREMAPGEAAVVASAPAVPSGAPVVRTPEVPLGTGAQLSEPATPGDPTAATPAPAGEPAGGANETPPGATVPGRAPLAPLAPIVAEAPGFDRMAALDYDLPADGESFGDEGTLADDFWLAFDETDGASGTLDDSGSGSEIL